MRIERHPIGVWVREDGCVFLPQRGKNPAHWTYGRKHGNGYLGVTINHRPYSVHRLIAESFIPNPEHKSEVDHINRNRADNRIDNLQWATRSENNRNTAQNDRVEARGGTHCYEDAEQYHREYHYRDHEKSKERYAKFRKTHKHVLFSDGKQHWLPTELALELLKLPVKDRRL